MSPIPDRLNAQLAFVEEVGRLKLVERRSPLLHAPGRFENVAEHSWHLALMVRTLGEHAEPGTDLERVLGMALVHDLVEIDAGDTYAYDPAANREKAAREARAAARIFGLLPQDQAAELRELWEDFEARRSPEARFAAALDRFLPLLQNYRSQGASWRRHGVHAAAVIDRVQAIAEGAPRLWIEVAAMLRDSIAAGWLEGGPAELARIEQVSARSGAGGEVGHPSGGASDRADGRTEAGTARGEDEA